MVRRAVHVSTVKRGEVYTHHHASKNMMPRLDKISEVFGHILDVSFLKLSNVVDILLVTNGDEIDSNPLSPIPSTTTDTMDVVLAVCG